MMSTMEAVRREGGRGARGTGGGLSRATPAPLKKNRTTRMLRFPVDPYARAMSCNPAHTPCLGMQLGSVLLVRPGTYKIGQIWQKTSKIVRFQCLMLKMLELSRTEL